MPISVNCPSCLAGFNVKDEYAGRRAKCPKCGEPLTIPAAAPPAPAAPVVARPVVAARVPTKPPADEEDEDVRPKRKRGADSDDEPVSPTRKRGKADDDDAPKGGRRRRRRDDDDAPKKKGGALPVVLIIVGGVLLLCCGGPAGVWFFVFKPKFDAVASFVESKRAEDKNLEASREALKDKFPLVKAGMTKRQVEDLLGPADPEVQAYHASMATNGLADRTSASERWESRVRAGHVLMWRKSPDMVLVAFSTNPNAGGTVVGTVGDFGWSTTEPIKLPAAEAVDIAPVTLTAEQLPSREDELKGRTVVITGKVESAAAAAEGGMITLAIGSGKKQVRTTFKAVKWNAEWAGKKMKAGDGVTIKGVVGVDPYGDHVLVKDCELLAHTPEVVKPEDRTPVATLTPDELAINFADMKDKWITLKGEFKTMATGEGGSVVLVTPGARAMVVHPLIGTKFAFKTPPQPLDNLEFTGKVAGSERLMILGDSTLLSQSANTEKATAVTADDLTTEFDKDADAATKKYEGKLLKVTGPVNSGGNTGARLGLRGVQVKPPGGKTKAYFLDGLFDGDAREAAKGVKLGDTATIVGRFAGFSKGPGETYTIKLTTCRLVK